MHVTARDEFLDGPGLRGLVSGQISADLDTPLSAYWKISQGETHSFLLESVVGGERLARYSILGTRPQEVIRGKGDPRHVIRAALAGRVQEAAPGLPKFMGGLVGCLAYDCVRFFERLPNAPEDDLEMDDFALMATNAVVVFDHAKNHMHLVCPAERTDEGYDIARAEIERLASLIQGELPSIAGSRRHEGEVWSNMAPADFQDSVTRAIDYIEQGDCIQVVLSQRFTTEAPEHPIHYYRALRSLNPSPYMFLLRFGDFDLVGASPEILVGVDRSTARVRPIAGTRARGETPEADDLLARELLADEKERAEHVMLVDLGRNDLGRVCKIGTVKVNELMTVERYSHVMHIVSDVSGQLDESHDAVDVLAACFPAGTVSGAPKVRAMEIIDELEPSKRGIYAGAVGYVADDGNMDLCIAIRTMLLKDGLAHVQAGAGIVYDSDPEREYIETCNKATACLTAIAQVHGQ